MPNFRRWRVPGGSYFFTVNLLNRSQRLLVEHIDILRAAFREVRAAHPFTIDAIVILPDHLHAVWTLPPGDEEFSMRWRQIKSAFSRALPKTESRSRSRTRRNERGIWQRRFYEHVIRDDDDYGAHVDYAHFNPVKHGLVERPIDWPYSSLHRYMREGILPPNWGTDGNIVDLDLG